MTGYPGMEPSGTPGLAPPGRRPRTVLEARSQREPRDPARIESAAEPIAGPRDLFHA